MATRIRYAIPTVRELVLSSARRISPGGLAGRLRRGAGRQLFIVTGPGRSGTSAVARVLHESGIGMGTSFAGSSEFNATGFYEDLEALSINQRIMEEAGLLRLDRGGPWPWRSAVLAIAARYRDEMREVVARATGGWKDPRFCATLEAWLPELPGPPKVIICLRSPEAFVHSVVRMVGLVDRSALERFWADELERLLAVIDDYRLEATCVEYEQLVRHPDETVDGLSGFVGQRLDAGLVQPDLRHFDHPVPRRYAALYERVRALGPAATELGPEHEGIGVEDYVERAGSLEARVQAAQNEWSGATGSDPARFAKDNSAVRAEIRLASQAYIEVISGAQADLVSTLPPEAFERYHELLRDYLDRQRLVAHLTVQALDEAQTDPDARDVALHAWTLFATPDAVTRAHEERTRELDRARRASEALTR